MISTYYLLLTTYYLLPRLTTYDLGSLPRRAPLTTWEGEVGEDVTTRRDRQVEQLLVQLEAHEL